VAWNGVNIVCFDKKTVCPSEVTPEFLDRADGQWSCNNHPGLFCTMKCEKQEDGGMKLSWAGNQCGAVGRCPPHGYTPPQFFDAEWRKHKIAEAAAIEAAHQAKTDRLADKLKAQLPQDGHAWNVTELVAIEPEVLELPWNYKGKLVVKVNQDLLSAANARPRPNSVTLVTGLFDLGRGNLGDDKEFKRPFSEYIRRFRSFLGYKLPKIAFIEERYLDTVGITVMTLSL
jgi:hypothetical protein